MMMWLQQQFFAYKPGDKPRVWTEATIQLYVKGNLGK